MNSHFRLKLFSIAFICFSTLGKPDLTSDKAALLALRSHIGGKTFRWNATQSTPCTWQGVNCENNRVTVLRLPADELYGVIPVGVFGNLTRLRTLSLRVNALTGQLPSDLAQCTELRNLYLQNNRFSGEIPSFLFKLHNLVRLNLAGNNFSGDISPAFNNLTRLGTLFLENNQLSGSIPELNLPKLVQFNVSYNQLNGSIPSKLRSMNSEAFQGNSLCGGPLGLCPGEKNPTVGPVGEKNKKKKLSGGAIAGIAIGSVIAFLLIVLIIFLLCRKRSSRKTRAVDITSVKHPPEVEKPLGDGHDRNLGGGYSGAAAAAITAPSVPSAKADINNPGNKKLLFFGNASRFFDLEDLLRASAEVLGKGTFGTAYKAVLEVGTTVAVKRLKDVAIPEKEFREKIEIVGSMDHENLVPLRAYYYSVDEKLLVYDYMTSGSLSALLHGNRGAGRTPLNWEARSGIALGAARGIEYLHSRGPNISHGNIKSSNILLTKNYDAHVSDFGLAQLVGPTSTPNRVAGYRAPEVTDVRKVSQKADVYSFGVLLLELLTGKAPTHAILNEEGVDLPRWVQSVVREEWTAEVFDLELLRYQNTEEEMVQLLQLAIDCAAQYPDKRPTMTEVIRRIEEIRHSNVRQEQDPLPDVIVNPDDS
ncbi:Leucine-rich repeat receptor-like protein kinase pxc1 [Thalictrum thalictroides]|uniref:Leucine-rich repeat receptor-like protein kinase pxc1 n=1 Tax=Thalictrum thalictroides TaxID=46969 RepID=A0A7J6V632_THATH|nr:Leucine-rich repeat receptor-like protein kinase pxc1 [Thalictrum thalictroides]